jgi:hypothetical protein
MSGFLGMLFLGGGGNTPPAPTPSEYISFVGQGGGTSKPLGLNKWSATTGMGTALATPVVSDVVRSISFVPDNATISISTSNSPWITIWEFTANGIGSKYQNPNSLLSPSTGGPAGFSWTTNVDALITANYNQSSSVLQAWRWTPTVGLGTKYQNQASAAGFVSGVAINGDSTLIAWNRGFTVNYIRMTPWSLANGFGTQFTLPGFIQNAQSTLGWEKLSFNKVTNDLALATPAFPFVFACSVTSAGFGSQYSSPQTPLNTSSNSLAFSPDGAAVGIVSAGSPSMSAYRWGGGFGTKYANPEQLTFAIQRAMDWSSTGNAIAGISYNQSPFVNIWRWSSDGFGQKYSVSAQAPTNKERVSFSNKSR